MWHPGSPLDGHVEALHYFFFNLHLRIESWKICKVMTIAGIIYSFLFSVQFLDMITFPNKRFILSELWAIICNWCIYCVCVLCVKKADWILFMIWSRAMFQLYESELHCWHRAVNVGHEHALLNPCLMLAKSFIKYRLCACKRPWNFLSHLNSP